MTAAQMVGKFGKMGSLQYGFFDPAKIFAGGSGAGGSAGILIDLSDPTTRFQSGTRGAPGAAAVSASDPIGLLLDKSGNQWDLTQDTAGSRPLLGFTGGKPMATFDGTDDYLFNAANSAGNFHTFGVAVVSRGTTGVAFAPSGGISSRIAVRAANGSGTTSVTFSNGTNFPSSAPGIAGAQVVLGTVDKAATTVTGRLNGVAMSGGSAISLSTTAGAYLGARPDGALPFNGDIYAAFDIARALTAQETTQMEQWLASKVGAVF